MMAESKLIIRNTIFFFIFDVNQRIPATIHKKPSLMWFSVIQFEVTPPSSYDIFVENTEVDHHCDDLDRKSAVKYFIPVH